MAKKQTQNKKNIPKGKKNIRGKSITKRYRGLGKKKQRQVLAVPTLIISAIIVGAVLGGIFLTIAPPEQGSVGEGYFEFQILDTDNQELIDGEVAITNFETGELIGIYDTGEVIYTDISIIATLYDVTLDGGDTRDVLPFTIVPLVEGTPTSPQMNTIGAYFYFPIANISVECVELDSVAGSYDHTDIPADTEVEIALDIDVDAIGNNSIYGASSYVPDYMLPTESAEQNISGFGLWLHLNETEIVEESVLVNGFESSSYYISDDDYSIILLDPMWYLGQYHNQTITLEIKTTASSMGIFQGFIDDISTTYIQIV